MGTVAVIGEEELVAGFGLAGAVVLPARDESQARAAWQRLPTDAAVVILTATAADALKETYPAPAQTPFVVVMT
ncbi:V-type ATP synthase subunit F [Phytohabitans kaempferiae]|uniref:V-type ATP synthase subunit F n=1 Tax=Phytohabitans kaempferiae TaxID=1620943 RepID=A0ABV6M7V2_9ACTN